ncbi:MAG TPA: hypothetical protein VGG27_21015 [Magnetospirillaceae bacterium]|jgi:hypothetical protein
MATIPAAQPVVLVEGGGFSLSGPAYSVPLTGVTGLFGWGSGYRLDAGVQPNLTGGYTAGLGATLGAAAGERGSGYSLRVGGAWSGLTAVQSFSANPVGRLGMADMTPSTGGDMALSFDYHQSIASGLSLTGAAEAYHGGANSAIDPTSSVNQLVLGAGIALRF